jgi:hypothetical protein
MSRGRIPILVAALLAAAPSAAAVPVRWTLQNVAFEDGGRAEGWFVYDEPTGLVIDWSLTVTGGDTLAFPPATWRAGASTASVGDFGNPALTVFFYAGDPRRDLRLTPVADLTDEGGEVLLDLDTAFVHSGGIDCFNCDPWRDVVAGSLSGRAEVPVRPATWGFLKTRYQP